MTTATTTKRTSDPFSKVRTKDRRCKVFCYGDTGSGKTSLALQFPDVVIIDAENGCEQYADIYDFKRLLATDPDEMLEAVEFLRDGDHAYKTLVIDPITIYWETLQKKWNDIFLRRKSGGAGWKEEYYEFQVGDWSTIKADQKGFFRKMLSLDMNLIVTARQKTKFSADGQFHNLGPTFDGEKSLPYLFDCVLHLDRVSTTFHARVIKDRGLRLKVGEIEAKNPKGLYGEIASAYGLEHLERDAEAFQPALAEQVQRLEDLRVKLELNKDQVARRLGAYGAESFGELSTQDADLIVDKMTKALAKKLTQE